MKKGKITEKELASEVVDWLSAERWDVYQEVRAVGGVHDIVATKNRLVWIVECKVSRSLALLDQVLYSRRRAHFCSVAVPHGKSAASFTYMLNHLGVGELTLRYGIRESLPPRLNRTAHRYKDYWEKTLHEEQKDGSYAKAGTADGGYYTPFKATCRRLLDIVRNKPGIQFKEAMNKLEHHYSTNNSARSCMLRYLYDGVVEGVEIRKEGKNLTLHPKVKLVEGRIIR